MLFLDSGISSDDKISQLASEVITLKHVEVESSIIATTCWNINDSDDIESDQLVPITIPTELQITVVVFGDQSENETLYQNTGYLFDNFDPSDSEYKLCLHQILVVYTCTCL